MITKDGQPFVEVVPARRKGGVDWAKMARIRRELGLDKVKAEWPEEFDDPAFSRRVLGLEDD